MNRELCGGVCCECSCSAWAGAYLSVGGRREPTITCDKLLRAKHDIATYPAAAKVSRSCCKHGTALGWPQGYDFFIFLFF